MVVHACDLCVRKMKTSISPRPFGQSILAQQTLGQPERPCINNTMRTVPMRTPKVDLWPQTCAHIHATRCIDTCTHVYPHTKTLSTTMRSMRVLVLCHYNILFSTWCLLDTLIQGPNISEFWGPSKFIETGACLG